jgi:murein DD-endopeptidase MepM/ murein hydrolase activator NlpD
MDNLFMGKNGFVWWIGVVEDAADPHGLGRCKVRIIGWHNPNQADFPTAALPWAFPIMPINGGSSGGFGWSHSGPKINTRVFGFFADGESGQQPMMLGVLQGNTVQTSYGDIPYGNSIPSPAPDRLTAPGSVNAREGDCPDGYDADNTVTNSTVPDPRLINITAGDWQCPATGFISSPYGPRGSSFHNGVDICPAGFFQQTDAGAPHLCGNVRGPVGQPIYAAGAGKVAYMWTNNLGQGHAPTTYDINGQGSRSFGNAIAIFHDMTDGPYTTIYAHLGTHQDPAQSAPGDGCLVKVGDTVSKGQQIGIMGRTHNRDTPTHLHFEIRIGHGLPRSPNHVDPGRIFKQMAHKHTQWLGYVTASKSYTTPIPYKVADAPVVAGAGPTAS